MVCGMWKGGRWEEEDGMWTGSVHGLRGQECRYLSDVWQIQVQATKPSHSAANFSRTTMIWEGRGRRRGCKSRSRDEKNRRAGERARRAHP